MTRQDLQDKLTAEFGGDMVEGTDWQIRADAATIRKVAGYIFAETQAAGWTLTRRTANHLIFDNGCEMAANMHGDHGEILVY